MGFTMDQWAVVALVFVLGWLLGMLSRSAGSKWRRAYGDERAARKHAEAQSSALRKRLAELESHHPVGEGTADAIAAAAAGSRDDLALIRGVGRAREISLNDAGVHRYRQIEDLSASEAELLETRLGLTGGTIASEQWREQAAMLRCGDLDGHSTRYGAAA